MGLAIGIAGLLLTKIVNPFPASAAGNLLALWLHHHLQPERIKNRFPLALRIHDGGTERST